MGGDGGSVPTRSELLNRFGRKERGRYEDTDGADPDKAKHDLASLCALSHHPLARPVVIDDLGNLFSKTSVLQFLLDKKNDSYAFKHIKSIKHVYEAKALFQDDKRGSDESTQTPIICPVTNIIFNGIRPFVLMRECRCVVSENAMKRLGSGDKCVACEAPLKACPTDEFAHFIPLLPEEEAKDKLRLRLFGLREKEHEEKQRLKREKKAAKDAKKETAAAVVEAAKANEPAPEPLTKKEMRKLEKKRKRMEEKQAELAIKRAAVGKGEQGVDERASYDPRFKSKVFASMFLKPGEDDATNRKSFMSGISTKAISQMSYL